MRGIEIVIYEKNFVEDGREFEPVGIQLKSDMECNDIFILCSNDKQDRSLAHNFKSFLEQLPLQEQLPLSIVILGEWRTQEAFERAHHNRAGSTFIFCLMSSNLVKDEWIVSILYEAINDSLIDLSKRGNVIPLHICKKQDRCKYPYGTRALVGLDITEFTLLQNMHDTRSEYYATKATIAIRDRVYRMFNGKRKMR